jgi:hypothetical protein
MRYTMLAGRAWIGSPSRKRVSSSATARAESYRRAGSRSRHFSTIVSRSRGIDGTKRRGDGASSLCADERRDEVVKVERRASGEELVEDDAEAVDVRAAVDEVRLSTSLFRRHVAERPRDCARERVAARRVLIACESEVDDVGTELVVVTLDEDVARLQIAMDGKPRRCAA